MIESIHTSDIAGSICFGTTSLGSHNQFLTVHHPLIAGLLSQVLCVDDRETYSSTLQVKLWTNSNIETYDSGKETEEMNTWRYSHASKDPRRVYTRRVSSASANAYPLAP